MKNLFNLFLFAVLFVSFGGCKNNDNADEAWRTANTNAYDAITKNPDYHALQTASGPSGVYYKDVQTDTTIIKGTVYPLQTSTVKALYSGTYYDGTFFDKGTSQNGVPVTFSLAGSNTIRGFSFALQQMVVGDKWEIWIPYYLGYGATGLTSSSYQTLIKGYTTLVFTVELVSITQYPE